MAAVNIIKACAALIPVPGLSLAFETLRCIWSSIQGVQLSKRQLEALAASVGLLLRTLDGEIRSGRLIESIMSQQVNDLQMSVVASHHCPSLIDFKAPEGNQIFRSKRGGSKFPQTSLQQG
jgi:hypothetical protein